VRDGLGVGGDRLLMGVVGDVIARKGLIHLIRALPGILHSVPQAHLLCVGHTQDAYAARCRAEAEVRGVASAITWAGPRSDIDRILAGLDIYVLPSLEENLPLAILEAMASGCPVVATAVGGIPECVTHNRTGLLVPPSQEGALAEALIRVLQDPALRQRFGQAGRERIRDCFSIESQIPRLEAVFQRTAA
jgi:glycosyltransferase involved in cell wall biosynthesis